MDFSTAFSALSTAEKIAKNLQTLLKNTKGHKRAILRELKENINLLQSARENDLPLEKVIRKLEYKNYLAASDAGFSFKLLKRAALKEKTILSVPQFKKYVGWSTERLFENIYFKIREMQHIVNIAGNNTDRRMNIRIQNLFRLMILLLNHIRA